MRQLAGSCYRGYVSYPAGLITPLSKKGALMRRIMLLLAAVGLVLLLVGGVAVSKQQQEQSSSRSSTTSDKSGGEVSIQSTTEKASFASGRGANRLSVKVSNHGNLLSFVSPAGQEAVFDGNEGYVVCTGDGATVHGHDTGSVEGGFGKPRFTQPTAGAFPLSVTRNTTGGAFQLKQVWSKPDAKEKDVTVTMTLKNLSSATLSGVTLVRTGDFDVGTNPSDQGARTNDSLWQWDDVGATDSPPVGLMLTALSFGTSHAPRMDIRSFWGAPTNPTRDDCFGTSDNTPTAEGDYAMRMIYLLGNLSAGQSKTVKLEYRRM